jgi:hypothetical protein
LTSPALLAQLVATAPRGRCVHCWKRGESADLLLTVVGLLPAPLQKITTYSAALMPGATAREPTRELISFLTSPAGTVVFKAKGMDAASGK